MKHLLKTSCMATIEETWIVEASPDADADALMDKLDGETGYEFVSDRVVDGEGDREFVESEPYTAPAAEQAEHKKHWPHVLIVVEGGVVQGVYADAPVQVCVKNFDDIDQHSGKFTGEYADPDQTVQPPELKRLTMNGVNQ